MMGLPYPTKKGGKKGGKAGSKTGGKAQDAGRPRISWVELPLFQLLISEIQQGLRESLF